MWGAFTQSKGAFSHYKEKFDMGLYMKLVTLRQAGPKVLASNYFHLGRHIG